ncbi:MAG: 16S rRNA (cytosine(1402)-N(4))-methyltransferase RsmH [Deltaproteobacteria bacterium]|nr:16S rRNA (cytosine(1402)-N(4))-methyltransferase RsmH [Deltaproteobacteria bacterium]
MAVQARTVHRAVMQSEVLQQLGAEGGGDFLDCTLGGGGHTRAILEANSENQVTAADRDESALARANELVSQYQGRLEVLKSCFSDLSSKLEGRKFQGVLADLGVSSDQLQGQRGFSFNDVGPLDMRMDEHASKTAYEVVNNTGSQELYVILKNGGVGKEARRLVQAIVAARPIQTTAKLAEVIRSVACGSKSKLDPATLAFQAIRMAVNDELPELQALLQLAPEIVRHQGRLVIITFHSLEDRAVTARMREWQGGANMPALWPGALPTSSLGKFLTNKALRPSEREVDENPRARSARLRAFEFA